MLNPSDSGAWQRTSPFAIVFFVGKTVRNLARNLVQVVATFGALAILLERNSYLIIAIPVGIAVIIAVGVLQYWFFRFQIEDDRILIRQGFLKKTALDLPFDRIQGINVERSLINRVLGLVTISLDTAGSMGAEGQLPSVSTELADSLKGRVEIGMQERADPGAAPDGDPPGTSVESESATRSDRSGSAGEVLLKLNPGDIVRIGVANRNVLFVAAFLTAISETFGFAEAALRPILVAVAGMLTGADGFARMIYIALFAVGGLAVVLTLVIGAAFLRYHNYTLWRDGTAYRSRAGLLTQRGVLVETAKIQQLTLSQGLVLRCFRSFRLRALPAALLPGQGGNAPGLNLAEVLEVPLLRARLAEDLRSRVFGGEGAGLTLLPDDAGFARVSPWYIRGLALRIGIVPAFVGTAMMLGWLGPTALWGVAIGGWWAACFLLGGIIAWQLWRRRGYLHDDDGLVSRSGLIGRKVDAFLFRKAQSVNVVQSPLQRRKRLATLEVGLACGLVRIPYIDLRAAHSLKDYILYKVESSQVRWH